MFNLRFGLFLLVREIKDGFAAGQYLPFCTAVVLSGKGSLSRRRVVQHKLHHIRTKQRLLSKRFPIIPRTEERNHINDP